MADLYLGESADPEAVSGPSVFGMVFTWAGALMSVALIGGLAMWGYQLAVRDVTGVPVVRALEGPMRVAPDDPGGEQAEHQGFAVNNVAADGVAEGPAERLVLAPAPLSLSDEDLPRPGLAEETAEETTSDATAEEDGADVDMLALASEISDGITPLGDVEEADLPELKIIPASVRGVSLSPVPVPRPLGDATADAVVADVLTNITPTRAELDSAEVPEGERLVQFGAFASPEEARAAWTRLDERFTDFLTNKSRVIEKALSGGKTFYRLRAMGFADISDARRFCAAFVADGQACIPVVAR